MKLKLDMSCHLLNAYTKFQIDISKHVEKKSGKLGRTDGRTDGQTDGHCHSIIRPFFKRAYKNVCIIYGIYFDLSLKFIKVLRTDRESFWMRNTVFWRNTVSQLHTRLVLASCYWNYAWMYSHNSYGIHDDQAMNILLHRWNCEAIY